MKKQNFKKLSNQVLKSIKGGNAYEIVPTDPIVKPKRDLLDTDPIVKPKRD